MKWSITSLAAALALACMASCNSAPQAGAALTWHTGDAWTRVAELEDARKTGDGELVRMLDTEDAELRARVATALGRMPFPEVGAEVTRALLEALFDPDANVRAAAAFGLGMRGDPSAADKLLFVALDYHEADKDGLVRARALEAATKLDRAELRDRMLDGLLDSDPRVRLEAAEGASRWALTENGASVVNQRLVDSLANEKDPSVITYTLFALERRKAKEAQPVFERFDSSTELEQRLFAVRGLKALAQNEGNWVLLISATHLDMFAGAMESDGTPTMIALPADWRVQCEGAIGLGSLADAKLLKHLIRLVADANAHVRRCAWDALGTSLQGIHSQETLEEMLALIASSTQADPKFSTLPNDSSASAQASMWEALVPAIALRNKLGAIGNPELVRAHLIAQQSQWSTSGASAIVGAGFARGLAKVDDPSAVEILKNLGTQGDLIVRGAAIEALAKHPGPETREFLHTMLNDADNGLRLAAVTSLAEMIDPSDLAPLKKCFDTSTGDGAVEIRFNVLRSVGKIGGDDGLAILVAAFADPNPFVRKVAREQVERSQPVMKVTELDVKLADDKPAFVPVAGRDFPLYGRNPEVEVVTTRGTMRFELFPQEAPTHVFNFLKQIERKHYDGLLFHRVVPDFVIQGGDYRGDGNGGGTWRGDADALRHEVTPRKYVRGSLGMPRNEDFESGGSQFFVTHRPTPHLDGRYTIFGELREGFDVLDAIEVGDKIETVRVVP